MNNFQYAHFWHGLGLNVVPRKSAAHKHPAVKWKDLQSRKVTISELNKWQHLFHHGGVGFVTGVISEVIVIETDGPEGEALLARFEQQHGPLPETLTIRSGSGRGLHRYYKHPGYRVPTQATPEIKVDIKGDGGFCVLPPSQHSSGGSYKIVKPVKPAPLPQGLLDFIRAAARASNKQAKNTKEGNTSPSNFNAQHPKPVNRTNVAIVLSLLEALSDDWAQDHDLWLRVGFALHAFEPDEIGLAVWKAFSRRCPDKAEETSFEDRWASFGVGYDGDRVTLGTLIQAAKAAGWKQPCPWDYSASIDAGEANHD